ncbi:MAG: hypothetical protein ACTHMD_18790, partial [Flavisolibacter sp.]
MEILVIVAAIAKNWVTKAGTQQVYFLSRRIAAVKFLNLPIPKWKTCRVYKNLMSNNKQIEI